MKSVFRQQNSIFALVRVGYCHEAGNQNKSLGSFLILVLHQLSNREINTIVLFHQFHCLMKFNCLGN